MHINLRSRVVIPFSTEKTIQASVVLLKEHAGRMSRMRLLKLLYIADRELLAETLRPITGDHAIAMDHGPVLSHTYDLIKRKHVDSPLWDRFIAQQGPQDIAFTDDPGVGQLSQNEIGKLTDVAERFRNSNDYDIALVTHQFAEFIKNEPAPPEKRKPIPLDDLLQALNLSSYKQQLQDNERAELELDRLLRHAK
jgi:uncharacterized phage-associated protein